jgi:hypothetical protein
MGGILPIVHRTVLDQFDLELSIFLFGPQPEARRQTPGGRPVSLVIARVMWA